MDIMESKGKDCGFCHTGEETVSICGRLYSRKSVAAHQKCMQYSATLAQYECTTFGGFDIDEVKKEILRASRLKCHCCKNSKDSSTQALGASAGCAWQACRKSFHFLCARQSAVTRRMILTDKAGRENVLYRVFCKEDHLDLFVKKYCAKLDVLYTEDSDEDWEPESDPETETTRHKLETSSSPSGLNDTKKDDDKSPEMTETKNTQEDTKSNLAPQPVITHKEPVPKKKMKPTRREPEPSMFEAFDSSDDEAEKENDNSLTASEEGDLSRRRYTRNQMQVVEAKMPGCLSPEKKKCFQQNGKGRTSPRAKEKREKPGDLNVKNSVKNSQDKHSKPTGSPIIPVENRTSPRRPKQSSNKPQVDTVPRDSPVMRSSPRRPKSQKDSFQCSPSRAKLSQPSDEKVSGRKKIVVHPVEESSLQVKPKPEKVKEECKSVKRKRSHVEVQSQEAKKRPGIGGQMKSVKTEGPNLSQMESQEEDLKDAFVICLLEDKYHEVSDSLHITRMVQKQFVVAEHRMTRWKYGGDEELNHDQMLYLMREITKALLDKKHSEVYRLLFELGRNDLDFYQNYIDFNQSLGDLNIVLENKLRENIVENLKMAQERYGKRIGCVINMSDTAIMLVLLINDYLDDEFKIRTKLGHSFSTHLWSRSTYAKDLSQFTPDVAQYFNNLELQNLCELLESRMKGSEFELYLKPSDAILQLKNTSRVSERLRFFMKLKRKKMDPKAAAQTNVLFIGPLDTTCLNTKGYCQKSIPLFVEENLTGLKDVYVVVDLAVGCGIHGIEDLYSQFRLPPNADVQVWSAFNPAIVPVTCAILHCRTR